MPADSSIQKISDLKGKTIGVISMGSGVLFAKAAVASAGLDPERDVKIVVAGEGAQTAAMVRSKQVDALSQFDTQYAMVENAGIKLRLLDAGEIDHYPGSGLLALEETLRTRRKEAVALARGYAKGTIFAINNPEAAVRMLYEVFPQAKPTGKDETTAISDDIKVLQARIPNWRLENAGVTRWGESSEARCTQYLDFLLKWGVIKEKVGAQDLITNELIDEIDRFDSNRVAADAKVYRFNIEKLQPPVKNDPTANAIRFVYPNARAHDVTVLVGMKPLDNDTAKELTRIMTPTAKTKNAPVGLWTRNGTTTEWCFHLRLRFRQIWRILHRLPILQSLAVDLFDCPRYSLAVTHLASVPTSPRNRKADMSAP